MNISFIKVQEVRIVKQTYIKGSGCDFWNVDLDGKPFGQIRKFRDTETCKHPYTAICNNGAFAHKLSLQSAKLFIRGEM